MGWYYPRALILIASVSFFLPFTKKASLGLKDCNTVLPEMNKGAPNWLIQLSSTS
jgi:hypothetical protein